MLSPVNGGIAASQVQILCNQAWLPYRKEKAALAWTERVTLISTERDDDKLYENLKRFFTEEQIVILTWAIIAINSWNRLNVSFKTIPGTYEPRRRKTSR